MDNSIYDAKVGDKLTHKQLIQAATGEVVLHEERKEEKEKDATDPSQELKQEKRNYRYPINLSTRHPAYITFRAIKVEGADFREAFGDIGEGVGNLLSDGLSLVSRNSRNTNTDGTNTSEADNELSEAEKTGIKSGLKKFGNALKSYENLEGGVEVGSVMLPLQQSLTFQDGVTYNEANLGIAGSALGTLASGKNPFEGIMGSNGQLSRASAGIASSVVAKNLSSIAGAAIGSKAGVVGTAFGASALGNVGEGIGAAVKNASRVTTNPNQRTMFENVKMRSFSFTFKMIANNAKEAQQIKDIVKFFREEVYPESIVVNDTPLAYEFPNMFEIEIKNFNDGTPAPKIQRCYLESVQTVYNATANSMHTDGNFVEVDVSVNFREIVTLNKQKVRDEGY